MQSLGRKGKVGDKEEYAGDSKDSGDWNALSQALMMALPRDTHYFT